MKTIVNQVLAVAKPFRKEATRQLCKGNRRLERNIERAVTEPDLQAATLAGVLVDHRVIETLQHLEAEARALVLRIEARLGRKLSRERARILLNNYQRVRRESQRNAAVKTFLSHYETKKAA